MKIESIRFEGSFTKDEQDLAKEAAVSALSRYELSESTVRVVVSASDPWEPTWMSIAVLCDAGWVRYTTTTIG